MTIRSALQCHPATPCTTLSALHADVAWQPDGALHLRFVLAGAIEALRIPAQLAHAGFRDGLWQHTCCEAFITAGETPAYREFNFAPSGEWAAYAFSARRVRDPAWHPTHAPVITTRRTPEEWILETILPAGLLPTDTHDLHIGLTAVIEDVDATLSYWALAHPDTRPDFHRREAFCLRVPSANHTVHP
ncbi:MAG: hypothetical protein H6R19_2026 [Proteobacteria bacterium]|nr:hypothetical protein [Pseudomonadota bacterium]